MSRNDSVRQVGKDGNLVRVLLSRLVVHRVLLGEPKILRMILRCKTFAKRWTRWENLEGTADDLVPSALSK